MSLTIDMPLFEPTFRIADKEVTAYSEAELALFKEAFAAKEKQRSRMLTYLIGYPLVILAGAPMMAAVTGLLSDPGATGLVFGGWLVVIAVLGLPMIWYLVRFRRRKCTACCHDVDHCIGRFCPCCGHRTLKEYGKHPSCTNCGAILKWNQWIRSHPREFRLHTCSVCGVKLSDGGV